MKSKTIIIKEAFHDIMYSEKTLEEVLNEVYECGFTNGFKAKEESHKTE